MNKISGIFKFVGKPIYWLIFIFVLLVVATLQFIILVTSKITETIQKAADNSQRFFAKRAKKIYRGIGKLLKTRKFKPKKRKPKKARIKHRGTRTGARNFIFSIALISASTIFILYLLLPLPSPNQLITRKQPLTTKILDRNGELLYKIYRKQNRTLVRVDDLPDHLIKATIAIEDAEFYNHLGFSPKAILRSFLQNLRGGKIYGGSTITQQLVKNALLTPEKTLRRKIREFVLAIAVEIRFSKEEILQMYFNEVGYGGAVYGIEEAAQAYFEKPAKNLTLAESALLAGIPASPNSFSPFGHTPESAKERQLLVLKRMNQEGFIDKEQEQGAINEELKYAQPKIDIKAPHFVMYVKDLLVQKYGEMVVEEGGLEVTTSLDLKTQEAAQSIVSNEIDTLGRYNITNGAAVVTNPETGEILAMVGSRNYFDIKHDGNVNVTTRLRQPGSAIKPVNYSIALENGFTPATLIPDTPITYRVAGQPPYSPKNYDGNYHGNVTLRTALASSYNIPAVKVLAAFGVERMIKRGQEMGITTWDDPSRFGLSLTLGGGEVKMVDMAVVYGTLANMGKKAGLAPILEVKNSQGKTLEKLSTFEQRTFQILNPRIALLLSDILSDNNARTPAFGYRSWLNIANHPHVAVKTGTTQNLRDNWTVGYTSDFVVVVWVGNNNNNSMSYVASGITGASPIWNKIMTYLLANIPDKEFPKPEGLKRIEICQKLNTLPCEGCGGYWEWFIDGTQPKYRCTPEQLSPSPTPTP